MSSQVALPGISPFSAGLVPVMIAQGKRFAGRMWRWTKPGDGVGTPRS